MHLFSLPIWQIVPYFGLLFTCFEMCKQLCLYRNGYIVSPLSYKLTPGVDQSLGPYELQEVKRYLKNRNFASGESSLGNRWWMLIQKHGREVKYWLLLLLLNLKNKFFARLEIPQRHLSVLMVCNIYLRLQVFRFDVFLEAKKTLQSNCFHNVAL